MRWFRKAQGATDESATASPAAPDPEDAIDAVRKEIAGLLDRGDVDTASAAMAAALTAHPENLRLQVLNARLVTVRDGWGAAAAYLDRLLADHANTKVPPHAFTRASYCHRMLKDPDRAEQIVAAGLARYPRGKQLLREAAEVAMARSEWATAGARWVRYWRRAAANNPVAARTGRLPVRGAANDWFQSAWSPLVDHLDEAAALLSPPPGSNFYRALARTLEAADQPDDLLRVLSRGVTAHPEDRELRVLQATAQLSQGVPITSLPPRVGDAASVLAALPPLAHDPTDGLGPIRLLRLPVTSSVALALRTGHYIDRPTLRRQVREVSTRDQWPEATSETNLLMAKAHQQARRFAERFAEPPSLPAETLTDAMYHTIHIELVFHLPMKRVARSIAAEAGSAPVVVEIPTTEFPYLRGFTSGDFDLVYLYFELLAAGCNAFLCQLTRPELDDPEQDDTTFRFVPGWGSTTPRLPVRDPQRHRPVALVPAGIRSIGWVADQLPDAAVFQSGAVIKQFAYDRALRQGHAVSADVRLHPEEDVLETFAFDLTPAKDIAGIDLVAADPTPANGQLLVTEALGGDWHGWLGRAAMPLLRHLAVRATEEVEFHGVREAHIADHLYAEGVIVGDAVRRAGGKVTLHPHSSNPVHVHLRRPESFTHVHAVTRTGVGIWRKAHPGKPVKHTSKGMMAPPAPPHQYTPGAPVSLVLFGGRSLMGHVPIMDLDAHEALYRSFFEAIEELQATHAIRLYFKPRGLSGEHEAWLHRVVGDTAGWQPIYDHAFRLELPNMVFGSVSMGTSALIEGFSRGLPGLIVREFPVRDYTTLDADTMPILPAAAAAKLVATLTTEAGYRKLVEDELGHYRDELALGD